MIKFPSVYEFSNANFIFRNEKIILPTPEGQRVKIITENNKEISIG